MLGVAVAGDADVIAFIDDDAFAEPDWLQQLLSRYGSSDIGGVGGRASNGRPGEEQEGLDAVGRILPDGTLTGNFAADTGRDVDVDHLLGANMSLRLSAVTAVGGIEDFYPGTCLREESEIALRLRNAGYRMVYTPAALVEHVAGDYAKGRRFDARYSYYAQRNHFVLLSRVYGRRSPYFRRYRRVAAQQVGADLAYAGRALGRRRLMGDESIITGVARGMTKAASTAFGAAVGLALVYSGRIGRSQTSGPR
jgi:GT2 family glycosyltransferase